MKNLSKIIRPILFRTIPKPVAKEWVMQAQNLLQAVEKNVIRELYICKGTNNNVKKIVFIIIIAW